MLSTNQTKDPNLLLQAQIHQTHTLVLQANCRRIKKIKNTKGNILESKDQVSKNMSIDQKKEKEKNPDKDKGIDLRTDKDKRIENMKNKNIKLRKNKKKGKGKSKRKRINKHRG